MLAQIGVIGGSGFYEFLPDAREHAVTTPYGDPSDPLVIGSVGGRSVAFLPRHGRDHRFPPHGINYRANLWALRSVGVEQVVAPCAVGSLRREIAPGSLVVVDQLVDRTWGRDQTFYDGPAVGHVSFADPYCVDGRAAARAGAAAHGFEVHDGGALVVVQGPRFSTRAESRWYADAGFAVIGMTSHPEAVLARELGLCYTGLALVTDYDVGVEGHDEAVTMEEVLRVFAEHTVRLRAALFDVIGGLPVERTCECAGLAAGLPPLPGLPAVPGGPPVGGSPVTGPGEARE